MPLSRKGFLSAAALGASAAALASRGVAVADEPGRASVHFHVLKKEEYDYVLMMKKLGVTKAHKQVFQSVSPLVVAPGIASVYIHMQNAMNAYEYTLGYGAGSLATLAVFTGPSIVLALNDDMWTKYQFGDMLKLAPSNVYYKASSNLDPSAKPDDPNGLYQDWSAQAVLKRGGSFMVCHNATTFVAGMIAMKSGANPQGVLDDFTKNMLPGFMLVPAGVAAVQQAQEKGWKVYPII